MTVDDVRIPTGTYPMKSAAEEFLQSLASGFGFSVPIVQGWLEAMRLIDQQLKALVEKAAPVLGELAQVDWASIKRRADELPQKSKIAMTAVAEKGWFFGWNDSLRSVMGLVARLEATSPTAIDEVMVDYYRENLAPFTDELVGIYPQRACAIRAAVMAHSTLGTDGYLLSIPVFTAQTDGIWTEITGVASALMRERGGDGELQGSRALRRQFGSNQEALDLTDHLIHLHKSDFMKSAAARRSPDDASGTAFTALNRHQVMHGESSNYGTEINSLKAFSLLVNVGAHAPLFFAEAGT